MEKYWLQSRTVISLILATLAMWSPSLGLDFTAEDGDFVMQHLNELAASVFALFALFGRAKAETKLRFK